MTTVPPSPFMNSCGGVESRHATEDEGVSYPEAQANALPSHGSYRSTGEEAPAGPSAGSWIETAGVAPGPQEATSRFSIDEKFFFDLVDPPPLPPLFISDPSPAFLAGEIEPLLKTLFHRAQ